jgi:amino acid transporter
MIAIGGSIGSGLFIGSGKALSTGGPAMLITGMKRLSLNCLMEYA